MSSLAFLLASTEEGGSALPFYVTGLGLAVFAVVVSVVGIKRPSFLASEGAARGLMGLSVVLVVLAMAAAAVTAA